jgi:Ca2+-binding EF-hand superfamily protein
MSNNGLTNSQINALKLAFDHCDKNKNGKINIATLLDALHCLDYDSKSIVLYSSIKDLDTETIREDGLTFEQLMNAINNKLFTDDNTKQIEKQFNLLRNNEHEGIIDNSRIKEILHEISRYLPEDEINQIIKHISKNEKEITLNDFTQKLIK